MTYRGTVHNGVIELDAGASLPDGTVVEVRPASQPSEPTDEERPLRKYARLARRTGLPADLSVQHDHYLYGTPKR